MKRILAIIAMIFTIGMIVEFRPVDIPPDVSKTETVNQELKEKFEALPAYRASISDREVLRIDLQPSFVDSMTFKIDGGLIIPIKVKTPPNSNSRLDKEFDPGRCTLI